MTNRIETFAGLINKLETLYSLGHCSKREYNANMKIIKSRMQSEGITISMVKAVAA